MAGADLPDQPIDGMSLVPVLADSEARLDREAIYFHYPHYHHSRPAGAIRAGGQDGSGPDFPDVHDGERGVRFIHAVVKSSRDGHVWTPLR